MNRRPCACTGLAAVALLATALPAAAQDDTAARIVVTATRRPVLEIDAPAAISVVTARDIERRGADSVLEALRGDSGITLQGRAVGGRKVFGLRGMDSRHALFLIDGRRIGASDGVIGASDFQYDWVAVEDIERIEVVRGPMSALYGSEALGGVVNVVTRRPGDRWRFGATAQGSDADGGRGGGGWKTSARTDGPLGAAARLRAGVAASRLDAVASAVDPRLSELEAKDKQDAWIGAEVDLAAGQRVELEQRRGSEQRRADARERGGRRRYHVTTNDIDRSLGSIGWQAQWSAQLETRLRAYRSMIETGNRRSAGVTPNLPQRIDEDVLEGQASWTRAAQAGVAGFEARNEALEDPGLPGGRSLLRHRSLFAQDTWQAADALQLTLGLRHDDHARYGREWSPRAYAVWHPAPGWTVKGGASHGFKVPNLKQVVPGARQEGPNVFLGNPDLRPERSNAVEVGAGFDAAGGLQAQLMLFEQRLRNLIDVRLVAPGTTPGVGTYTYENLARARMRGIEASLARPLGAGFSVAADINALDARDGNDRRLERRPRRSLGARLEWAQGPWRAGLRVEHAADQLLPSTTVGAPAQPVPDLSLWSAHAGCDLGRGLDAAFGVDNLGNVSLAAKSPLFTHAEAPRTWRLTLRWRWPG